MRRKYEKAVKVTIRLQDRRRTTGVTSGAALDVDVDVDVLAVITYPLLRIAHVSGLRENYLTFSLSHTLPISLDSACECQKNCIQNTTTRK